MKRIIIIVCSFLLIFLLTNFGIAMLARRITALWGHPEFINSGLGTFLLFSISFGLIIFILIMLKANLKLEISNLAPNLKKLNLPLIVISLIVIFAIGFVIDPLLKLIPKESSQALYEMMKGGVWAIMTAVVMAPLLEEYIFRGILQRSMIKASNPMVGIIVSSLVFGLIHIIPIQVINSTLIGLVLGSIFYVTGSLITVVAIHLLNNGISYLQFLYLGPNSDPIEMLFNKSTTNYGVAYGISCLIILIFAVYMIRGIKRKTSSLTINDSQA